MGCDLLQPGMSDPCCASSATNGRKQCTRAELFDVTAEDSREQRAGDSFDDLLAEVAAYKCCDALICVGAAIRYAVREALRRARLCCVGLLAVSVKSEDERDCAQIGRHHHAHAIGKRSERFAVARI